MSNLDGESFWLGIATIPAVILAGILLVVSVGGLAWLLAWAISSNVKLRKHSDKARSGHAAVILGTTGNFVTLRLGKRLYVMFETKGRTDMSRVNEFYTTIREKEGELL